MTVAGERGAEGHLSDWVGATCVLRTESTGDGVVLPKPMNTVCGPSCESTRVEPPKYLEGAVAMGELVGRAASASALSTRSARRAESMPVPTTATLPDVKASFAKDFTDSRETGVWGPAKRDAPRPVRKARACAASTATAVGD